MSLKAIKKEIKTLEATVDQLWANSDRLKEEIKEDPSTREEKKIEILNNHAHIQGIDHQIYFLKQAIKALQS